MRQAPGGSGRRRRAARGFTLVELLVSLTVMVVVLVAVLGLLDHFQRIARVQVEVSELQQSLRIGHHQIVRFVRMAGRGGLPAAPLPHGRALSVANDVPPGTCVDAPGTSHHVVAGTDVLTVRGVFTSPVLRVSVVDPSAFVVTSTDGTGAPRSGVLRIRRRPLGTIPLPQELTALERAVTRGYAEALVLVSPLAELSHQVVELDPETSDVVTDPDEVVVGWRTGNAAYDALGGGSWDPAFTTVAFVGLLEEYRFYVEAAPPGAQPRLVRARAYPGSSSPHAGAASNWSQELADGVVDLQVALGVDHDPSPGGRHDGDGVVVDDRSAWDEWLYNHPDDDDGDATWRDGRLFYLRVSVLARTRRPDRGYVAEPIHGIEDHEYLEPLGPASEAARRDRMYRRHLRQTVVDVRNLW